jgi:dolichol-phosphate mannosyltransferase
VLNELKGLREHDRFLRGLITWVGYAQKALPYHRAPRSAGYTKYPFLKMVQLATNAIISFSDLPLRVIIWMGLFTVALSGVLMATVLYMYFFTKADFVRGYASLAIIISFFSGMILLALGMLGLYVGRIYTEVLSRPLYLISRTVNLSDGPAQAPASVPENAVAAPNSAEAAQGPLS